MHLPKTVRYVGIIYQNNYFLQWKELLQTNIKYLKVHNVKRLTKEYYWLLKTDGINDFLMVRHGCWVETTDCGSATYHTQQRSQFIIVTTTFTSTHNSNVTFGGNKNKSKFHISSCYRLYVIDDQIYMKCRPPQGYVKRIMPHLLSREDLSTLCISLSASNHDL